MKTIYKLPFLILAFICFSCKKEKQTKEDNIATPENKIAESTKPFSLKNAENEIKFTAYKTTEKKPVGGLFKKVELINNYSGNTIKEAINGAEFKIPVSSIETNDSGRNYKIQKFFFGVMSNTLEMTGKFNIKDDSNGTIELKMNDITKNIDFTYKIEGKQFKTNCVIDIDKWNAQNAIKSLNDACKDLHKGADGISKTWSEVNIEIKTTFE